MKKDIGTVVKDLRDNLTLREFGELLEIPASTLCDIENGKLEPSKEVAKKLAAFSGLPLEQFIR